MYLKELEIYGFKSFASKVKMPLKPGITCIVGPNGCGKSNVVDSLKWCIGEMSWKSLRMPSMMDVIFAGTTRRRALNMAEVSMTFDNTERKLPLDFSEVTVTRKIYRSEESEYFINKVQCRLKDIREMFLDTGIGTGGYAIIDQGQIEHLLNATSEERREMFEEAAGVSKYKSRREEAYRRLEKVEADLNRLSDSMVLLQEQIKKLEAEARKARLQQKYRDELKGAEISLLVQERNSYLQKAAEIKGSLEPLIKEADELRVSLNTYEASVASMNLNLTRKNEELRQLREKTNAIKLEKNSLEGIISHSRQTVQDIAASRLSLETAEKSNAEKIARIEPRIKEINDRIAAERSALPGLREKVNSDQSALQKTQNEIKAAEEALAAVSSEMNASFSRELALSQYLARSNSDSSHLRENLAGLERDRLFLEKNASKLKNDSAALEETIKELSVSATAEKEKTAAAEKAAQQLASDIQRTERRISEIREETAACKARLGVLLAQARRDSYWVGCDIVLKAGIPGVLGAMRSLLKFKKADMIAVEDALGRYLDSVVCENMEAAEKALNVLEHSGKGRCRFIILDRVPPCGDEVPVSADSVLSRINCRAALKPLIVFLLHGATVSGAAVRGQFWLSGGAGKIVSNEPYWGEETEINDRLAELSEENKKNEAEKAELKSRLENLRRESVQSREKAVKINLELNTRENQLRSLRESVRLNCERMKLLSDSRIRTEADIKKAEESAVLFEKELSGLRKNSEELKKKQAGLEAEKERAYAAFAVQKENYAVSRAALDSFSRAMSELQEEAARGKYDLESLNAEKSHFAVRRSELDSKEKSLEENARNASARLGILANDLAEKEISCRQTEEDINSIRLEFENVSSNLKDCRALISECGNSRVKFETELSAAQARADDVALRLTEAWNISPAEAEEKYGNTETDHERVVFLRRRVEAMGPVNMTAPEEHEALAQRCAFITSQVEDLNKAKTDLRAAIKRINDTTRENFKNTFYSVRGYFKEIYSLLFNGGEADLILTDPDNLLDTGVEILARPPGKRPVSITQLSGGEKALTALALLFSFFRVNPSPFCVMDETDAPLDEANVGRFVRLIREFSDSTQFLVITHNKRTMEAAGILYGVTMEESGVSKLVSVDLKHAAGMAEHSTEHTAA